MIALRRTLAAAQFVVAGLFLLFGVDGLVTKPTRSSGGGDGIGAGWFAITAVPFLLSGIVLAAAAYAAWRGGSRWWIWQAALPVFWAVGLVGLIIYMIAFNN